MGFYTYTGIGHELDEEAAWDYIRHGYLLGPRTVLKGRTKIPSIGLTAIPVDLNKLSLAVQETIVASMGKMAGSHRAVMFSGGFDSMLLALLAKKCGARVTAVTVRFDDFNPLTVAESTQFAHHMGIPHHIIHVKAAEFLSAFEPLAGMTDEPLLDLDLAVVYAALKKYDRKIAGNVFISGMGCDQWFSDVAFRGKSGDFATRMDWVMVNVDAHQRIAQEHGCRFVFPFLSVGMLSLAQVVPSAMKKDKKLIRSLAVANMIPRQDTSSEEQVPPLMRHVLIKMYGDRAWPCPVSIDRRGNSGKSQLLRQIVLGLWLEKRKAG